MTLKDSVVIFFENFPPNDFNRTNFNLNGSKFNLLRHWKLFDLILVAILAGTYQLTYSIQPFQRSFSITDLNISHPFTEHETVTNHQLFLYSYWIPLCLILTGALILSRLNLKIYTTWISLLGLNLSMFVTLNVTNILKNFIGNLRPDFLSRCIPKPGTPENVLVLAKDVCTSDNLDRLLDGFRSTPSGHSSLAFAGLFYLTLWLMGQLVALDVDVGVWRSIICFIPSLGAALIAVSRLEDYRHHYFDVMFGSAIGILVSTFCYFKLFPSLNDKKSFNPRSINEQDLEVKASDSQGYSLVEQQV